MAHCKALGPQDDACALPSAFALERVGKAPQFLEAQVPACRGPGTLFMLGPCCQWSVSLLPNAPPPRSLLPVFPHSRLSSTRWESLGSYFSCPFFPSFSVFHSHTFSLTVYLSRSQENTLWGWNDGLYCSCRGLEFGSQHPDQMAHSCL